uniref:Uncharacterized protein n=1 Tax=Romanomermis culicivorax TaxID=13658 RepID=A0A915K0Z8_ROMCU
MKSELRILAELRDGVVVSTGPASFLPGNPSGVDIIPCSPNNGHLYLSFSTQRNHWDPSANFVIPLSFGMCRLRCVLFGRKRQT